ncbi:hypothetical protein EW093_06510 [Thiospirochaeta perfilievii]|uniref:Uncharacterized protein n=1 Tax=Thiospirochaeta perfilievii TaxID=252967 RepID=A0A5C1QCH8_9SPIO|nr:hypothetical protein [Thiospirochaeta perfilievii]QEN04366.1 hypothetical protein EW093_06510 [Thiospirochaeta perfilievii]
MDKLLASNRIDIFQTLYGTALSYIQENIEDRKDLEIAMWYRNKIVINLVIPKKNKKLISSIRQGILDVGSYNTYKERVDISPD